MGDQGRGGGCRAQEPLGTEPQASSSQGRDASIPGFPLEPYWGNYTLNNICESTEFNKKCATVADFFLTGVSVESRGASLGDCQPLL